MRALNACKPLSKASFAFGASIGLPGTPVLSFAAGTRYGQISTSACKATGGGYFLLCGLVPGRIYDDRIVS